MAGLPATAAAVAAGAGASEVGAFRGSVEVLKAGSNARAFKSLGTKGIIGGAVKSRTISVSRRRRALSERFNAVCGTILSGQLLN